MVADAISESYLCPVEVWNPTDRTLSLSRVEPEVRGSIPVGVVEWRAYLRFEARCGLGTVWLYGYSDGFSDGELVAYGSVELSEGRVARMELERRSSDPRRVGASHRCRGRKSKPPCR